MREYRVANITYIYTRDFYRVSLFDKRTFQYRTIEVSFDELSRYEIGKLVVL